MFIYFTELIKKLKKLDYIRWINDLAMNAEVAAQNIENKELYKITTVLSNTRWSKNSQVRDKLGELLTGWEEQASRWREDFSELSYPEISKEEADEALSVMNVEN